MAKKVSVRYVCSNCGAMSAAWSGRCAQCGEWNTLTEEVMVASAARTTGTRDLAVASIADITLDQQQRISAGMKDVDTILGGGIVPGSIMLIAGQPGIGKSTLLLQIAAAVGHDLPVLYVSGEESEQQVALRARRLTVAAKKLHIVSATDAEQIAATITHGEYSLVVIDSIQTISTTALSSSAGTVSQITASTQLLMAAAKGSNTAVILVGHVTKEGVIAGPKVLEHIVDVVLQLEGEAVVGFKLLRAQKNRFGPTNEAAIFEMTERGMSTVANPSAALLEERQVTDGSVVLATIEGSRPLLVEVQALVNPSSYGYPKRAASGIDLNRVNLLVAMLERRTKLKLSDQDIYVNIVGGIRLQDPAADLAVCMAIGSAAKGLQLRANAVVFGEVGLSGEVRRVPLMDKRISEAKKLGFDLVIGPPEKAATKRSLLQSVPDVRYALNHFLEKDAAEPDAL